MRGFITDLEAGRKEASMDFSHLAHNGFHIDHMLCMASELCELKFLPRLSHHQ